MKLELNEGAAWVVVIISAVVWLLGVQLIATMYYKATNAQITEMVKNGANGVEANCALNLSMERALICSEAVREREKTQEEVHTSYGR